MASTYLTRTPSSAGNRKTFTISVWVKRTKIGVETAICSAWDSDNISSHFNLRFTSSDTLNLQRWSSNITTNRLFRDTSGFYHIVVAIDTTQGTASDRVKIYVNGVQETLFSSATYPNQNDDLKFNSNVAHNIGRNLYSSPSGLFDGCMSHFHFCDGLALAPTVFGSTDSTTGEWKINTSPSFTLGTNGFTILKDGNTITDQSSNSNNFTLGGGTLTNTEDCPSNVFATFNRLTRHGQNTNNNGDLLENGNTVFNTPSSTDSMKGFVLSTLGMNSGKYYCEIKVKAGIRLGVGICNMNVFNTTSVPYDTTNQSMLSYSPNSGNINYDGDSTYATGVTATENDILGFALDMDNNHWYIHKNGNYFNSGNPASGSTGTGSIISNITNGANYFNHDEMFFFASDFSTTGYARAEFNFGNGYFGTTAISSEGTNASGNGKFEYDVPTGYTALSTKGLNE